MFSANKQTKSGLEMSFQLSNYQLSAPWTQTDDLLTVRAISRGGTTRG